MAAGFLAKGPVGLALPALAALALALVRRDRAVLRRLHLVAALAGAGALGACWYAAAFAREGAAFVNVVVRENVLRFVDTEAGGTGHAHGPLYLVILGLVGLLPWTALLALAVAPVVRRPRSPAVGLAAAWLGAGLLFFEIAAGKRSVYLLPLYPAAALLVGAGVARPPSGRLGVAARIGGGALVAGALLLAVATAACAFGLDPVRVLGRWLEPADAAGAAAVAGAARAARGMLLALVAGTLVAAAVVAAAIRRSAWRRIVVIVALLVVAWTAAFDGLVHPAIARRRTLADFMMRVGRALPADAALYAFFPADPGLRFYAPRRLEPWPPGGAPGGGALLLWEGEWRRLRGADGAPLVPLLVSAAAEPGRGHVVLVEPPPGALVVAPAEAGGPARPPGLRRGSSPP
jgi:hypothetical protein